MDSVLVQRIQLLGSTSAAAFFILVTAWRLGYFTTPFSWFKGPCRVQLGDLLSVFALFLGIELVLIPAFAWLSLSLQAGHFIQDTHAIKISIIQQGWLNTVSVMAAFVGVTSFLFFQNDPMKKFIVWGGGIPSFSRAVKDFALGMSSWIISYPIVIALSQIIGLIAYYLGPPTPVDQVAVKHLKMTLGDPLLFYITLLVIIFFVPLMEEILFRGFLQRWLVEHFGRIAGIAATAILFALFHFSFSQRWENIELILSLIILGLFLGFLYERQGSLWAPAGLHMTFNAVSVFFITWGELSK